MSPQQYSSNSWRQHLTEILGMILFSWEREAETQRRQNSLSGTEKHRTWKRANRDNPREPYGPDLMLCCGSLQQTSRKQNLEANLPEILGMILTVSKSNTTTDRILGQNIFSEDLSTFFWVDRVSTTTSKQVYFKIRVRVQSIGNKFSIMDGHFSFDCLLEQGDLNVLA